MATSGSIIDGRTARAKRTTLSRAFLRLGKMLEPQAETDAVETTEIVIAGIGAIQAWLESGIALVAIEAARHDRLEAWEEKLWSGETYLAALRIAVQDELSLSLRERNMRRLDLVPQKLAL